MHCILHIGPEKTGTSTIQQSLLENQSTLASRGIFVPKTRSRGHHEFSILCQRTWDGGLALRRRNIMNQQELEVFSGELRENLSRQLNNANLSKRLAVISTENVARRTEDEIKDLKYFLSAHCDAFKVIIYLRRQDLHAVSHFKNRITDDGFYGNPFDLPAFPYLKFLSTWANVFGRANVFPIIFPDSSTEPVDLLYSFFQVCGISQDGLAVPAAQNKAIDARILDQLRAFNKNNPNATHRERAKARRSFRYPDFIRFAPPRKEARVFYSNYIDENETIRTEWFPHLKSLFHDRFDMYPDKS